MHRILCQPTRNPNVRPILGFRPKTAAVVLYWELSGRVARIVTAHHRAKLSFRGGGITCWKSGARFTFSFIAQFRLVGKNKRPRRMMNVGFYGSRHFGKLYTNGNCLRQFVVGLHRNQRTRTDALDSARTHYRLRTLPSPSHQSTLVIHSSVT